MIKNIVVMLHVITAAGWFGIAMILPNLVRRAASDTGPAVRDVGSKAVGLMTTLISLTFALGLVALFLGGGFGAYGPQFHTSILLIAILVAIQFFVIRPAWSGLLAGGGDASRKKISMGAGIGHLIWLVVLVLMFWNHFPLVVGE
jgi:hypothetical protein